MPESFEPIEDAVVEAIIKSLAVSLDHAGKSTTELWAMLLAELNARNLKPKEIVSSSGPSGSVYRFDSNPGRKTITFEALAKRISAYRNAG